jgi:hypothetical protein
MLTSFYIDLFLKDAAKGVSHAAEAPSSPISQKKFQPPALSKASAFTSRYDILIFFFSLQFSVLGI